MTASDLLQALLRANLATGATVLIVIALRKPARQITGARQAYGLWLLPLLAVAASLLPARQVTIVLPALAPQAYPSALIAAGRQFADVHHVDPTGVLLALWLSGALLAALVVTVLQLRFSSAAARGVIGPAVVGVIRPRIITPPSLDRMFDAHERSLVMAHEEAHIARHDSRTNGLAVLFQCLFWFNPLVHVAAHLARIDQEMACDEAVITRFPGARQAYARALVKAQLATRPLPLGCCWPSGTRHPLEERIAMLKSKTKSRARRLVTGGALAALCAVTGVTAWAAQPPSVAVMRVAAPDQAIGARPALEAAAAESAIEAPAAQAATEAAAAKPAQVCITNACMPHSAGDGAVHSIADAIAKGDAAAVVAMGGSGKDVVAALRNGPAGARPGPGGRTNADLLDQMASMDNVTISNLNGEGRSILVSDNNSGPGKMILIFPELGPAPANAPVYNQIPLEQMPGATVTVNPDGTKTVRVPPPA